LALALPGPIYTLRRKNGNSGIFRAEKYPNCRFFFSKIWDDLCFLLEPMIAFILRPTQKLHII
jgi:hypothetical protein